MGLISRVSSRTYRKQWLKKRFTVTRFSKRGTKSSEGTNLTDSCASLRAGENPKVLTTVLGDVILELWLCQVSVLAQMLRPDTAVETNSVLESFWFITLTN